LEEELPVWFQLRKIPMEHTPEDAIEFAKGRIDRFARRQLWNVRGANGDDLLAGHILLRVAVATDPRLSAWLVEFEGDLFDYRFRKASFSDIIKVIRFLLGQNNAMPLKELEETLVMQIKNKYSLIEVGEYSKYVTKRTRARDGRILIKRERQNVTLPKGLRKYIGVHFSKAPEVVGKRQSLLLKGWAIAPIFIFRGTIKRAFESALKTKLEGIQDQVKSDKSLKPIIRELRDYIKINETAFVRRFETDISPGRNLYQRFDLFPECMNQLISILNEKGHLGHGERLQLGLFLKKLGMSMEDQKHFWYQQAVDNIGLTFEEFDSKVGYTIDHLYGQAGSGTDYEAPKCETIITSYYCAFAQKGVDEIMKRTEMELKEKEKSTKHNQVLDELMDNIVNNRPRIACAKLFELRYGKRAKKIAHPIGYTLYAAKTQNEKKKKKIEEKKQQDKDFNVKK
jgi:DNA primase large subunit